MAAHVKGNREEDVPFGKQLLKHGKFCSTLIKWENARGKNPLILPQPSDKTKTDESFLSERCAQRSLPNFIYELQSYVLER